MENDVKEVSLSEEQSLPVENPDQQDKPGSKTDSALLLESLKEERRLRREEQERAEQLEKELLAFKNADTEAESEEGRKLKEEIKNLANEISSIKEQNELSQLMSQFPALKDKKGEFDEFRKDYPRTGLAKVAKLFLSENGLIDNPQPRKGLEDATGGTRQPISQGMTAEEVKSLRETNFKGYMKAIQEGKIKL